MITLAHLDRAIGPVDLTVLFGLRAAFSIARCTAGVAVGASWAGRTSPSAPLMVLSVSVRACSGVISLSSRACLMRLMLCCISLPRNRCCGYRPGLACEKAGRLHGSVQRLAGVLLVEGDPGDIIEKVGVPIRSSAAARPAIAGAAGTSWSLTMGPGNSSGRKSGAVLRREPVDTSPMLVGSSGIGNSSHRHRQCHPSVHSCYRRPSRPLQTPLKSAR